MYHITQEALLNQLLVIYLNMKLKRQPLQLKTNHQSKKKQRLLQRRKLLLPKKEKKLPLMMMPLLKISQPRNNHWHRAKQEQKLNQALKRWLKLFNLLLMVMIIHYLLLHQQLQMRRHLSNWKLKKNNNWRLPLSKKLRRDKSSKISKRESPMWDSMPIMNMFHQMRQIFWLKPLTTWKLVGRLIHANSKSIMLVMVHIVKHKRRKLTWLR